MDGQLLGLPDSRPHPPALSCFAWLYSSACSGLALFLPCTLCDGFLWPDEDDWTGSCDDNDIVLLLGSGMIWGSCPSLPTKNTPSRVCTMMPWPPYSPAMLHRYIFFKFFPHTLSSLKNIYQCIALRLETRRRRMLRPTLRSWCPWNKAAILKISPGVFKIQSLPGRSLSS